MPNTREKLIELLETVVSPKELLCDGEVLVSTARVADHLIANGVAVGKPLTEYLHPVDNYAGLKGKYLVFKADTGEQVSNCFVLRPDKDAAAVEALRAYACSTDNKTLSDDIYSWVGKGVTVQELDGCEYCKEDGDGFRKFNGVFWIARPFHGGEWFIRAGNCKPRQIYFCHMCGRRLSQPPKGE